MNRDIAKIVGSVLLAVTIGLGILAITLNSNDKLSHDGSKWAVIHDANGDQIAIETSKDIYWDLIKYAARHTKDGGYLAFGKLIYYDNHWGYRIDPVTAYIFRSSNETTVVNSHTIANLSLHAEDYLNREVAIPIEKISVFFQKYRYLIFLEINLGIFAALGITYFVLTTMSNLSEERRLRMVLEESQENGTYVPLEVVKEEVDLTEKELIAKIEYLIRKENINVKVSEKKVIFPDKIDDEDTISALELIEEFVSNKYEFNYGNYILLSEAIDTLKVALEVATSRNVKDDLQRYLQIATDILHSFKLEDLMD